MFKGNFTLSYFGVFESEEEYYGKEIIEGLAKICRATEKENFFKAVIKLKQKTSTEAEAKNAYELPSD